MLCNKKDFEKSMKRIEAWFSCELVDRPPVRFTAHNAQFNTESTCDYTPEQWKEIWFDTEHVIDTFIESIKGRQFLAETFPVYCPNLGPDVYAAFYGCELSYRGVTSWSRPCVKNWDDIQKLNLDMNNPYFKKIEELTACALEKCQNRYLVGYTDLHPDMDCVLAWRGMEQLCFDLVDNPEQVKHMLDIASQDFEKIFDKFDSFLKANNQLSVTWMEIPSYGKMNIPSCDFAAMMSPKQFNELVLPILQKHVQHMNHNIFHLDGKDVARHLDVILEIPEINAIQWVQGMGEDEPIMQWIGLIKKIQSAGKGVIVDIKLEELQDFIGQLKPEGLFLCISESDLANQKAIIKRLERW
jgi:hypothetical protein